MLHTGTSRSRSRVVLHAESESIVTETLNMERGDDRDPDVAIQREFEHIIARNDFSAGFVSEVSGSGIGEIVMYPASSKGTIANLGRMSLRRSSLIPVRRPNPIMPDIYKGS